MKLTKLQIKILTAEYESVIAKKRQPYYKVNVFLLDMWRLFNKQKYHHFMYLVINGFSLFAALQIARVSNRWATDAALLKWVFGSIKIGNFYHEIHSTGIDKATMKYTIKDIK